MTGSRLGGCAPVAVMGTGPHLGGGPGVRPAPTLPVDPRGRTSATASAHGGISSPRGVPDGARFAGDPSGILRSPRRSRNPAWSFSVASCSVLMDDNSTGGDRLRLQWLIQGKRAED